MRSFLHFSGIFLTLALLSPSGEAADAVTCPREESALSEFSWLDDLASALKKSAPPKAADKTVDKAVEEDCEPEPYSVAPEPDEVRSGRYDLSEPTLSFLRKASRGAARKCRVSSAYGKRLCGLHTSKFLCYRGVKDALVEAGLVDRWWSEVAASDAHENGSLLQRGFKNLVNEGYRASNAPLGAVLVYSGGSARCRDSRGRREACGHIEIKLNEDEFCSDYCKSLPADAYLSRKLIGVYVKQ